MGNSGSIVVALESGGPALAARLRERGLRVELAQTGLEVVALLWPRGTGAPRQPRALVLSGRLPGYNGLSVLAGLRSFGWQTPVIISASPDTPWIAEEASRLGCAALLPEPSDTESLMAAVLSCLAEVNRPDKPRPAGAQVSP